MNQTGASSGFGLAGAETASTANTVGGGGTATVGGTAAQLSGGTAQAMGGTGAERVSGGSANGSAGAGIGGRVAGATSGNANGGNANGGNANGGNANGGNANGGNANGGAGGGGVSTRRPKRCDENGQNCKCLNLASFGARASNAYGTDLYGNPTSTTAFELWLAQKTNAAINMVEAKPNLSAEYLASLDVIVLQDMRKWAFSTAELQNLADWVRAGGGLIALSGYFNEDDAEVMASNQALAFSGMAYDGGAVSGSVPTSICPDSSKRLCPQSSGGCCYCWNTTVPIQNLNTSHPVMKGINALGAYFGRSISAGDATVLATYSQDAAMPAKAVAATKSVGLGQVILWGDEWITYTSQWTGGFTNPSAAGDLLRFEPCYNSTLGYWLTADHVFQTKQFWYNMIAQVAPPTECNFVVDEPEVTLLSR